MALRLRNLMVLKFLAFSDGSWGKTIRLNLTLIEKAKSPLADRGKSSSEVANTLLDEN